MSKKRSALGRGLGALIPPAPAKEAPGRRNEVDADSEDAAPSPADGAGPPLATDQVVRRVPIEHLQPNPEQPRRHFEPQALEELAASIKNHGIILPIVVSPLPKEGQRPTQYVIIAGERRWRAAQKAGLHDVPVLIRGVAEEDRLELALVENIQRADLNPMEEAQAYAALASLRGYSQEDLAQRVGKDRSTVANVMRLLRLPRKIQDMVREGRLSMGHARALLGLEVEDEITAVASEVVRQKLSVRATEQAVRRRVREVKPKEADPDTERRRIIVGELEGRLRRRLGVQVRLRTKTGRKGAGSIEVPYSSLDELDRLLKVILTDAS